MRVGVPVEIARNIIPLEYANAVRDYARGNLDEAAMGRIDRPWLRCVRDRMARCESSSAYGVGGSQMDDEFKELFFDAIDHFPLEQRDAAQRSCRQSLINRVAGIIPALPFYRLHVEC
jgi:hypothetical protein